MAKGIAEYKQVNKSTFIAESIQAADAPTQAIVQDVYQGATVIGEDNDAYQDNSQVNVTEEVNRTHHRGRQRSRIRIRHD